MPASSINGQFRTPRHIIRLMVDMLEPKPTDIVGDPACGTGGFLVTTMEYLLQTHTSPEAVIEETIPKRAQRRKFILATY
jgi:type I restriction enzyme M protein